LKDGWRKVIKIAGITLIAAAICVIGYSAWNLLTTEVDTQKSVTLVEQMLDNPDATVNDFVDDGSSEDMQGATPGDAYDPFSDQDGSSADVTDGPDSPTDATAGPGSTSATRPPRNGTPGPQGTSAPRKSNLMGLLVFESLGGRKVAVRNGVTERDLSSGAAHHPRTSLPGGIGNCVIFGHRNTVFSGFGRLKLGDIIRLEVPGIEPGARIVYRYSIVSMAVVEPTDPIIYKNYGDKYMTLVTCYPFNYVGAAPHRYIVVAKLQ
jgi:LPXTG-site transpeptidase (sortase) family protein